MCLVIANIYCANRHQFLDILTIYMIDHESRDNILLRRQVNADLLTSIAR